MRILSIDGGGIRGIVPALVLAKLEEISGRPVSELFDLIAGTSTGGILALGLVKPDPFSAQQMAELYEREGGKIFANSFLRRVRTLGNLRDEKYSSDGIEEVLRRYFGDARLKNAVTQVLIPSYEIERRTPFFFRSAMAAKSAAYDFPMWQVARATSAAPTYFEPAQLPGGRPEDYYALIDGGVYANNPALCALIDAKVQYPRAEDITLVSIGTGSLVERYPIASARNWGLAQWAKPVLNIVLDGVSETVDYQLQQLLPNRYFRLQMTLQKGANAMDCTDAAYLRNLRLSAEQLARDQESKLADITDRLLRLAPAA